MKYSIFLISFLFPLFIYGCGSKDAEKPATAPAADQSPIKPATATPPSPDNKVEAAKPSPATPVASEPAAKEAVKTPDGNIEDLRAAMKDIPGIAKPILARTSALTYSPLPKGAEINYDQCVKLSDQISANYKLSPFYAVYDSGSSIFGFCKDQYGNPESEAGAKFYYRSANNEKNQFGLQAAYVLQKIEPNRGWYVNPSLGMTSILLDGSYHMIEITYLDFVGDESKALQYNIQTLDTDGSYYSNQYSGPAYTGGAPYVTHQKYISFDGKNTFQQDLNPRRSDKGSEHVLSNIYTVANGKTWDDFFIVLSYAWFGGFYDYGGKISADLPKAYSFLAVDSVDGKEVCIDGNSSTLDTWTNYPSPTASYGYCTNDW